MFNIYFGSAFFSYFSRLCVRIRTQNKRQRQRAANGEKAGRNPNEMKRIMLINSIFINDQRNNFFLYIFSCCSFSAVDGATSEFIRIRQKIYDFFLYSFTQSDERHLRVRSGRLFLREKLEGVGAIPFTFWSFAIAHAHTKDTNINEHWTCMSMSRMYSDAKGERKKDLNYFPFIKKAMGFR